MEAKEPDLSYTGYTYADYLTWHFKEQVELIRGRIFKMSPAPQRIHQTIVHRIDGELYQFLKGKSCRALPAPFDVRLSPGGNDHEIKTVVQPDITVVCDQSKLDERGCIGAPDIVMEVLSPGNNVKELRIKYELYEQAKIPEYWIIQPETQTVTVYTLRSGAYEASRLFTSGDIVSSETLTGFSLNLEELFSDL